MYVVSYCIIVAFHQDLKIPRLIIFRSYDQNQNAPTSLSHFEALENNFFKDQEMFDRTTLKQLEDAAFSVFNREKNTALAEMFSVELKFTTDCLKSWFSRKHKVLDIEIEQKSEFIKSNPMKKNNLCSICDFPLVPKAPNGWADHVFRSEYLFLENIYSEKEMKQMKIEKFERYEEKINKILNELDNFGMTIEESRNDGDDSEIDEIIKKIKNIETSSEDKGKATKEKTIGFLYGRSICFIRSDKFKREYPILRKFLVNMISIVKNHKVIHHSHTTGKIIGYVHNFCNLRCT